MNQMSIKPLVLHCPCGITDPLLRDFSLYPVFFHQQNVNLPKWSLWSKLFSAETGLTKPPTEFPNSLHLFFTSLPLAATAVISSLIIRCRDCGILGRNSLKWSSVSLAPCEATKQNFISALSNWTTLITLVIFFLPCVISPLGAKCLCAKLQRPRTTSPERLHHSELLPCTPKPAREAGCTR